MAAALTAAALSCTASPARGRFQRININCSLSNKIVPNISSGSITLDLIFFLSSPPPRWKIKTKQRTTTTQKRDKRLGEKFCTNIVKMTENLIKRGGMFPTLKTSASSNQQNGGKRVWKSFTWLISHVPKLFSYA